MGLPRRKKEAVAQEGLPELPMAKGLAGAPDRACGDGGGAQAGAALGRWGRVGGEK